MLLANYAASANWAKCDVDVFTRRSYWIPGSWNLRRLLLDSRVVDLSRWSTPAFATLSSLSPLFFNGIRNVLRCAKSVQAEDPEIQ